MELREKYMGIGFSITHFYVWQKYVKPASTIEFPKELPVPTDASKTVKLHSYREYTDYLTFWGKKGLEEFETVFE